MAVDEEAIPLSFPTPALISREDLLRWLWPHSNHGRVAVQYPGNENSLRPGWIFGEEDVERAYLAFTNGQLAVERFETSTKQGKHYTIENAERLGLVLHQQGLVSCFCIDLDNHTDDGGNTHLLKPLSRFLAADPVVFTSKSGKGVHAFFELCEPIQVQDFVIWLRAWGFNREGQPELFPKTDKLSQVYMPGLPNEDGGDTYLSGTFESAVVKRLPQPPDVNLTSKTLSFLRGEVQQPGRNNRLNVAAMELGQKNVDRRFAWALCQRAAALCGLDERETLSTFESGYSKGIRSPVASRSLTDHGYQVNFELDGIGHAERFAMAHKDHARYCIEETEWYVYKTTRWVRSSIEAQAMAKETARAIDNLSARRKASTKHGIKEILYLAASEPGMSVEVDSFDGDPMLFNTQSGTIDLHTGKILQHRPSDLLRKQSPARYTPKAACPQWLAFLQTVSNGDTELIEYLQRVCGYMLTGDVREQCLFFLYGDGCNGKSVFCAILQHILGSYGVRLPIEAVMRTDKGGGPTPDTVKLHGARLAVATELEEGQSLAEARIKDITGADRIVARALYSMPIEFDPTHKLLLYGNHRPQISGNDHGIWRRIRLIPFTVTIGEHERDPQLLGKLKTESDAILGWMVQGCIAWQRQGLATPTAVLDATENYRSDSDAVGRFIEECCDRAYGIETPKARVYERYEAWCKQTGEKRLSGKALRPRMLAHGLAESRSKSCRSWIGITLRRTTDELRLDD